MHLRDWTPRGIRSLWAGALLVQTLFIAAFYLIAREGYGEVAASSAPGSGIQAPEFAALRQEWGILIVGDSTSFIHADRDSLNAILLMREGTAVDLWLAPPIEREVATFVTPVSHALAEGMRAFLPFIFMVAAAVLSPTLVALLLTMVWSLLHLRSGRRPPEAANRA
jgi:hypothetical protein